MTANNYKYPDMIVLGSTGSVGEQAIDIAEKQGVRVNAISANTNSKRVEEQARQFEVSACAMRDETAAKDLKLRLADTGIRVYSGIDGICEMISSTGSNNEAGQIVENSIVGEAGLLPTIEALKSGKRLALANKESLVAGGEIVMSLAREKKQTILPVDSEHCAIFQCLRSGKPEEIKKIILTASGGPFFGYNRSQLEEITVESALAHPTWVMGAKITIDSSTLMNKGFEVIEAVHLFGISPDKIQVTIHRESIIHSAVEYIDNSVIAQMSVPDMRHCVQYALTHPNRTEGPTHELDLFELGKMTFARPDMETFSLLRLAYDAIKLGGAVPAVLNASNEEAVAAFLAHRITYLQISEIVERVVNELSCAKDVHDLEGIFDTSKAAREMTKKLI